MNPVRTLAAAWLARSFRPFEFTDEANPSPPFAGARNLGLYVHVPFCRSLCGFCPYCRVRYDEALCARYLDALEGEIEAVGASAGPGRRRATSLYFGGGTPALAAPRLGRVVAALERRFEIPDGIGVELHPDDAVPATLRTLRDAGATRLSIGVQSFRPRLLASLGRRPVPAPALAAALRSVPFDTVSMDFIFALPGQTAADAVADVDAAFAAGANHVAFYPFIDFSFARGGIHATGDRAKRALLDAIARRCAEHGCERTSIWTFARNGARYSSMTRENYLGFGCSAATLLERQFKVNTFSVEAYCARIAEGRTPTALTLRFTPRRRMLYWLFWAFYGLTVDARDFESFFGVPLRRAFGAELRLAQRLGWIRRDGPLYRLTDRGAFRFHQMERHYTLAYIDRMWGLLRNVPFPKSMRI